MGMTWGNRLGEEKREVGCSAFTLCRGEEIHNGAQRKLEGRGE